MVAVEVDLACGLLQQTIDYRTRNRNKGTDDHVTIASPSMPLKACCRINHQNNTKGFKMHRVAVLISKLEAEG